MSQAASLMIIDKHLFSQKDIVAEMFSCLSIPQLYHLLAHFQPSKMSMVPVPSSVLQTIKSWEHKEQTMDEMIAQPGLTPSLP